jgi:hypothetical protein
LEDLFSFFLEKMRPLTTTLIGARQLLRGGSHHYKGYNEPTGHFLSIPPAPPGYRRKKLWYEPWLLYFFVPSMLLLHIGSMYKPETELKSWARQEALLRMKDRGEQWETPGKPY